MDDLIRRADAIKAIEDLQDCYNGFSDTYDKACIIGVLEELPSAQSETHEKRTETHGVCSDGMIKRTDAIDALRTCYDTEAVTYTNGNEYISYDQALDLIEALPSAQQWIPVTERLPKNDDWAVVTVLDESGDTPYRYTDFGWYLSDGTWVVDNEPMHDDGSIRVIAWMPLPVPWKGGEA